MEFTLGFNHLESLMGFHDWLAGNFILDDIAVFILLWSHLTWTLVDA